MDVGRKGLNDDAGANCFDIRTESEEAPYIRTHPLLFAMTRACDPSSSFRDR